MLREHRTKSALGLAMSFSIQHPKDNPWKKKKKMLSLLKIKNLTLPRVLLRWWRHTVWETIFVKHLSDKGLATKMVMHLKYGKTLLNSSIIKHAAKLKTEQNLWKDTSPKKTYRCQIRIWKYVHSLLLRNYKIKQWYRYIPIRMAKVQKTDNPNVEKDAE